ncbi:MAG: hypothetical protein HY646_01220, partial [Acidobacteria bacterium]|nr:hypothetical protein [Acidobacteriota bacterium]
VVIAARVFLERFGEDAGKQLESILPRIGLQLFYVASANIHLHSAITAAGISQETSRVMPVIFSMRIATKSVDDP